jgi:hypothetical protein
MERTTKGEKKDRKNDVNKRRKKWRKKTKDCFYSVLIGG